MTTIGRDQIDSAVDLQRETVPVPEWGGDVLMQEFTADGLAAFYAWGESVNGDPEKNVKAIVGYRERVVALSLINEDGTLLYPDWEEGVTALGRKSPTIMGRLADVALKLSGLADAAEKVADELPNTVSGSAS